ncbi:MAG: M3 family metallopeptidase [Bacteroidales bacterium]|nr:M3 family metallopeptidase [Bacteroidales bacterium]
MKKLFVILAFAAIVMTSCNRTNPFLTDWNTPYGIPPFEQIRYSDYEPAVREGIARQNAEIDAIVANPAEPDFDNVIAAFDRSGLLLDKVAAVLDNLSGSMSTPEMIKIVDIITPLETEHYSNIYMNADLFEKVKAVYDKRGELSLTREQECVLDKIYERFINNGVGLDEEGQARLREINQQLAALTLRFGNNLLAENNNFQERFGVSVSEYEATMAATEDRELRRQMFEAYSTRCNHGDDFDNKQVLLDILRLKIEEANLLGYETPAAHILHDKMAHDPATVDEFLAGIFKYAVKRAKEEVYDMQKVMDRDIAAGKLEAGSKIEPWDWFYYAEKVRKEKYDLDESEVMAYFQMEKVREGVFATASKLYGLQFEPIADAPKYHPEMEAFRVSDADGSLIGVILTDYYPRDTKRGGAWMSNFREQWCQDGENIRPIIVNVGNFNRPTADRPALLSIDNVETMFHEFGHALHGLLSQCNYITVSGTAVSRDFVELPSQINENWAFCKEVLQGYAKHYQTGEVIPNELVDKIIAAGTFNQGFATTELAAASILDMRWHELKSVDGIDVEQFEAQACREMGLIDEIIPRYRTTYFAHIFKSGYSAGYYSYLWAEVLDKDAFELFKQNGIFDQATATSFRKNILERGASEDPMVLYRNFRGANPDSEVLLRARGLK